MKYPIDSQSLLKFLEASEERDSPLIFRAIKHLRSETSSSYEGVLMYLLNDRDKVESRELSQAIYHMAQCQQSLRDIVAANKNKQSKTAEAICFYLSRNELEEARAVYSTDGDKIRQYPELRITIERTYVGCRMHGTPFHCSECTKHLGPSREYDQP